MLGWAEFESGYGRLCEAFRVEKPSTLRLEARYEMAKGLSGEQFDLAVRLCLQGNTFPTADRWNTACSKARAPRAAAAMRGVEPMDGFGARCRVSHRPPEAGLAEFVYELVRERWDDDEAHPTKGPAYFAQRLEESSFGHLFPGWIAQWREAGALDKPVMSQWLCAHAGSSAESSVKSAHSIRRSMQYFEQRRRDMAGREH